MDVVFGDSLEGGLHQNFLNQALTFKTEDAEFQKLLPTLHSCLMPLRSGSCACRRNSLGNHGGDCKSATQPSGCRQSKGERSCLRQLIEKRAGLQCVQNAVEYPWTSAPDLVTRMSIIMKPSPILVLRSFQLCSVF